MRNNGQRPWSAEDDEALFAMPPKDAVAALGRTYRAVIKRRSRLRHPQLEPTHYGARWTQAERKILRAQYPIAQTTTDLLKFLPRFTPEQIRSKAHLMRLRRKFFGDCDVPIEGHRELVDQIRIRAKQDGIALCKIDGLLKTGTYFTNHWKKRRDVNLRAVARAVEFFGGTLVIDWCDR